MFKVMEVVADHVKCPKYGKAIHWTWCRDCLSLVETERAGRQLAPTKVRCAYNERKRVNGA